MEARVRLTGELQVQTDRGLLRSTEFPGRQGRLVFARLAATPHPVSRDELADVVWPEGLPRSWERDLSAVVSKVRALLVSVGFDDPVRSGLGCYQLRLGPDAHVDIDDAKRYVEQAETALQRDELLAAHAAADVAVNHCVRPFLPGEYGDWVSARRDEQHQLLLRALDALVDVHVRRGILPEARRYAFQLVALEPYRESGYAALMRAQLAAGDRADALKTFERARSLLVEELGVPPGAILTAAHEEALRADAPSTAPAAGEPGLPTGTVTLLVTDFSGPVEDGDPRREHLSLLRAIVTMSGGQEVKELGGGLMAAFASATDGAAAAIAIQQAVEHHARSASTSLAVRIGVHTGEPVLADGDYFGVPVAVAKRLCAAAGGGEILASDVVHALAESAATFTDPRNRVLADMASETATWSVVWKPWHASSP